MARKKPQVTNTHTRTYCATIHLLEPTDNNTRQSTEGRAMLGGRAMACVCVCVRVAADVDKRVWEVVGRAVACMRVCFSQPGKGKK